MSSTIDYDQALEAWASNRHATDDLGLERLFDAESVILDHPPTSSAEAASLVEVLLDQSDPREDDRDRHALVRLLAYLRRGQ